MDPGYGDRIRALSEHAETLSPFRIGTVSLRAAVDGSGLSLTLSAPARLRMAALDGVAAFSGGQRWLVEPGGWETVSYTHLELPEGKEEVGGRIVLVHPIGRIPGKKAC